MSNAIFTETKKYIEHKERMRKYEYNKYQADKESARFKSNIKYYKKKYINSNDKKFNEIFYNESLSLKDKATKLKEYNFKVKNNMF